MLEELPETLDETHERMLRDIHKTNRDPAHRLLQCFTVAARPLRVTELAEVLAIDFETATPARRYIEVEPQLAVGGSTTSCFVNVLRFDLCCGSRRHPGPGP
jgi:hypothetical protein